MYNVDKYKGIGSEGAEMMMVKEGAPTIHQKRTYVDSAISKKH